MKKVRIVERTSVDGRTSYVIQEKHFLFKWWWTDAWINHGVESEDTFNTLDEAKKNLCFFDGTGSDSVVYTNYDKK